MYKRRPQRRYSANANVLGVEGARCEGPGREQHFTPVNVLIRQSLIERSRRIHVRDKAQRAYRAGSLAFALLSRSLSVSGGAAPSQALRGARGKNSLAVRLPVCRESAARSNAFNRDICKQRKGLRQCVLLVSRHAALRRLASA